MRNIKYVLVLMLFLPIFWRIFSSFPSVIANNEFASQMHSPEGLGPYSVGWIDVNIPKTRGGTIPILIFYPAVIQGERAEPNNTKAPYPTLLLSPGYTTVISNYKNFAVLISSWGFVFVIVGSNPEAWDLERAMDLVDALNWLNEQNDNSSFKLNQLMDESKFGVLGHSLGGTAAVLVFGFEHRFRVVIPIAPLINPTITSVSPESAASIHVPILIVVGSGDTLCPPSTNSYLLYHEANPPKICLTLNGADHYGVLTMCSKYIVSFLKLRFYEDQNYAEYLYGKVVKYEVDNGKIALMYDLTNTIEHDIFYNEISCIVRTYSNSTLLNFVYNRTFNQISFSVSGPPETIGTTNITIPTQLVPNGYDIKVYLDEEMHPFALTKNSSFYSVRLIYVRNLPQQITLDFVDVTPPIITITFPLPNSKVNSSNVTVTWNGSDISGMKHYKVKLDDGLWINVETNQSYVFTGLANGNHTTYVKAVDNAGNSADAQLNFAVNVIFRPNPIWMQWWFWAIICTNGVVLVILILCVKKGKKTK